VIVRCCENLAELEPYRDAWDALAGGCVFRSWSWLSTWWRHYGVGSRGRALRVFLAFEQQSHTAEALLGVLPCYLQSSWTKGRVLRLLGDGEVCSDHLGLLAASRGGQEVSEAVAEHVSARDDWDLLEFEAVDDADLASQRLHEVLALNDCAVSRLRGQRTWAIDLPPTWDEFLALQSKSHRKQLRQMERRTLQANRAQWRLVGSMDEFSAAWPVLVDLHQRRRHSLGEAGCFSSRRWAAFHWEVAQRLLARGRLRLSVLKLDGQPVAAEYHLAGDCATYAYQGGVEPQRLSDEPGQLSTICSIQRAIAEGHAHFDLLRGDEPYKAHWRAVPSEACRLVAAPPRTWPKLRHTAWNASRGVVSAAKQLTGLFG
jgi:CelD/BcsL family acetyltransferase involved in cellulose biosynthesis